MSLDEALSNVKTVKIDENRVKVADGQLVHIIAQLYTDEPLTEPDYNIQGDNYIISLRRELISHVFLIIIHLNNAFLITNLQQFLISYSSASC